MTALTKETFDWRGFVEEVLTDVSFIADGSSRTHSWNVVGFVYKGITIRWTVFNHPDTVNQNNMAEEQSGKKEKFYIVGAFTFSMESPNVQQHIRLFEQASSYIGQIVDAMNEGLNNTLQRVPSDHCPTFKSNGLVPLDALITAYRRGQEIADSVRHGTKTHSSHTK